MHGPLDAQRSQRPVGLTSSSDLQASRINPLDLSTLRRMRIDGWHDETDVRMFLALGWAHDQIGARGDLLEIGTFMGRSAVVLGSLLRTGERLVVNDLWDDLRFDPAEWDELTAPPSRARFEANYLRYHPALPEIVVAPSSSTLQLERPGSYRIVHVDGSHEYEAVAEDVAGASRIVADDGVLVFDDHLNARHPGVPMAVWGAVERGVVVPRVLSTWKLYATTVADALPIDLAAAGARRFGLDVAHRRCAGHDTIRVSLPSSRLGRFVPPVLLPVARRLRRPTGRRSRGTMSATDRGVTTR